MRRNPWIALAVTLAACALLSIFLPSPSQALAGACLGTAFAALAAAMFSRTIHASWERFAAAFFAVFALQGLAFLCLGALVRFGGLGLHGVSILLPYGLTATGGTLAAALTLPAGLSPAPHDR